MEISAKEDSSFSPRNFSLQYLGFADLVLRSYNGDEPFHIHLKKYFAANKKHGSKDRKRIASLCYSYFRLGFGANSSISLPDKLLLGNFLCESAPSQLLAISKPSWNNLIAESLEKKLDTVTEEFQLQRLFPFTECLSDEIDKEKFSISFLLQPKLFIRMRPNQEKKVLDKLNKLDISFETVGKDCLAFANSQKLTEILQINKEAIIQDYNSQRAGIFFVRYFPNNNSNGRMRTSPFSIWDCCAGSGGKSLLAADLLESFNLTVTDKRKSILHNLRKRFTEAGIKNYQSKVLDLALNESDWNSEFDMLIADVPCSGSGTWSRTPEQLNFLHREKIDQYASLQKNIIRRALKGLKNGGFLFYITCSVFKKENEENVDFFNENYDVRLIEMEYLKGYEMQADTLFIAVLKKVNK